MPSSPHIDSSSRRRWQQVLWACDGSVQTLFFLAIVFMPWAFGTTQPWAIQIMNGVAYALAALYGFKRVVGWVTGVRHARWTDAGPGAQAQTSTAAVWLNRLMAVLTVFLLAYCLVAALNARASVALSGLLVYRDCIPWLPHTYDQASSWQAFWMYAAWACFFWSVKDWLGGLSAREIRERDARRDAADTPIRSDETAVVEAHRYLPDRLRHTVFLICLMGGLIAVQGMAQRLSGSGRLLWLVEPRYNKSAEGQFGPFANRNNAAEFLNLIAPVCAGLAFLQARARRQARRHGLHWRGIHPAWFIAGTIAMGAAPFVTASRGGALVASGLIAGMAVLLTLASQRRRWRIHVGLLLLTAVIVQLAVVLGYDTLMERFEKVFIDDLSGRLEVYENTRRMAQEHPWFGTGPGSFGTLYQYYRTSDQQSWEAYAHHDWLELEATLGWVGFGPLLILLAAVPLLWLTGHGPALHWVLPASVFCAIAGCLVHARFDLPFRIYAIVAIFLVWCAVLCTFRRESRK